MTEDELVAACTDLADVLAAHADEGERLRRVPDPVLSAVHRAGILDAVVPTSLGGSGLGLAALCDATRVLAHGCPASAWTISFLMQHAWFVTKLPAEGRADLFAGTTAPTVACPLAPTGVAVPTDDGYRLTGRWEYATAVRHADWVMVHGVVDTSGVEGADDGGFATRFAVVPVDAVAIEEVWHTSGMRATGSETVVLEDVEVPAHRTVAGQDLLDGGPTVPGDGLAGLPIMSVLALSAASPALGAAEAAVEHYRARTRARVLAYSLGDRAAEQPAAQIRLAGAVDAVAAAGEHHRRAVGAITAAAAGGSPDDLARVTAKLAAASTVRSARAVMGAVCEGAGAAVYQQSHPLQRLQRDVEVLKGHVAFDWDRTAELAGRIMLGGSLGPTDMA